jgi:hypothetical protein
MMFRAPESLQRRNAEDDDDFACARQHLKDGCVKRRSAARKGVDDERASRSVVGDNWPRHAQHRQCEHDEE